MRKGIGRTRLLAFLALAPIVALQAQDDQPRDNQRQFAPGWATDGSAGAQPRPHPRVHPKQDPVAAAAAVAAVAQHAASDAAFYSIPSGRWQQLANQPPIPEIIDNYDTDWGPGGAAAPLLMTDGGVLIQDGGIYGEDAKIFKLTPDIHGSYINGTWSQLASKHHIASGGAQAVLADGRVILEGGEYSNYEYDFLLTNQGEIYDPVTNAWTTVNPPAFFVDLFPPRATFAPHPIGDSASIILPDGTFMLADKMSRQAALLNLRNLTWTETGTRSKADLNDEEGWTLLPDGTILTVDCYTDFIFGLVPEYPHNPTNSESYSPTTRKWTSAGSTINTLTDPILSEMGPGVLRPDGTVLAMGSSGNSAIYNTHLHKWSVGPSLPVSPGGYQYTAQDGPGVLLPNGHVLIAASGGPATAFYGYYSGPPVGFFEFDGTRFIAEPTIPNAPYDESGSISLLLLPTGQVLSVDSTTDVEIYTPAGINAEPGWKPVIYAAPSLVHPGESYEVEGIRFNGMSQACMYGDELQCATNYPLVRITNTYTKHVFYSRTHNHSSMAVASSATVTTHFDVPADQEKGPSQLVVVANGIASEPVAITVK